MGVLFLVFWEISILFYTVVAPIYNPTNSVLGFLFLHTLSSTCSIVGRLFDDGHSGWCKVVPHSGFDLHFSNNEWCWASFHVFFGRLYVYFGEMCLDLLPIFWWGWFFFDTELQVEDKAQIWCCCGCGVGWQLQLWFDPLAWESPYAAGVALKRQKKIKI